MELEGKWKSILIGGLITGLAPLVPILNIACCIVPLVGALVAVAVYRSSTPPPILTNNDGVVLGALSGLIGTGIYAVLVVPLVLFAGSVVGSAVAWVLPSLTDIPAAVRPFLEGVGRNFGSIILFFLILRIISRLALSLVFGIIGGLLGVALFKRSTSPQA